MSKARTILTHFLTALFTSHKNGKCMVCCGDLCLLTGCYCFTKPFMWDAPNVMPIIQKNPWGYHDLVRFTKHMTVGGNGYHEDIMNHIPTWRIIPLIVAMVNITIVVTHPFIDRITQSFMGTSTITGLMISPSLRCSWDDPPAVVPRFQGDFINPLVSMGI